MRKNYNIKEVFQVQNKNGLELIIEKIESDCNKASRDIIDKNVKTANEIIDKAKNEALAEAQKILRESEKKAQLIEEKEKSSCESYLKNEILEEKNIFIKNTTDEVIAAFLKSENYFIKLKAMILKYAHKNEDGEVLFGEEDLKKLPNNFFKQLNCELKNDKASLSVSKTPLKTNGGFILKYENSEENCTIKELREEKKNIISDRIYELMKE